jgi:hypothetical protein
MTVPQPFARINFRYCIFKISSIIPASPTDNRNVATDRQVSSSELAQLSAALEEISG